MITSADCFPHMRNMANQPSHAHPGPTWQISYLEMQLLPHAFPVVQILQHPSACFVLITEERNPMFAAVGFTDWGAR